MLYLLSSVIVHSRSINHSCSDLNMLGHIGIIRYRHLVIPIPNHVILQVRPHKEFSRVGFYNDIAVLVLDRPVKRNRYTIPLCLPPLIMRNDDFLGKTTTVVGWGTTYYGERPGCKDIFVLHDIGHKVSNLTWRR